MGKVLAIDFGLKRCGLAVSDNLKMIASGLDTIETFKLMDFLKNYINKEAVEVIVLGLPKRHSGEQAGLELDIKRIIAIIENEFKNIFIKRVDERFTSKISMQTLHYLNAKKKLKKDKKLIDKISATIILQSYLDKQ